MNSILSKNIKLVIIHPSALTQRWVQYYHLDELTDVFDIEWWNISVIASPHYNVQSISRPYVKCFESKISFLQALRKLPNDTIIDFDRVIFCRDNYWLLYAMSKIFHSVVWFDFLSGDICGKIKWGNFLVNEQNSNLQIDPRKASEQKSIIKRIVTRTKYFLSQSNCMAYIIETIRDKKYDAQSNFFKWSVMCGKFFDTSIISNTIDCDYPIHSQDYEQYLLKGDPQSVKEKYIVYIDQNFPLHPETARQYPQLDIQTLAEIFFDHTRRFFDLVEKQVGYKIVIALHPSSKYSPATFGNRTMVLGKTAELIRDSEAVIAHSSNAISYAVFWDKPLILGYDDIFAMCNIDMKTLNTLVRHFQIPSCDMKSVKMIHFSKMPKEKRNEFIRYYTNERIAGRKNVDLYKEYLVEIHDMKENSKK